MFKWFDKWFAKQTKKALNNATNDVANDECIPSPYSNSKRGIGLVSPNTRIDGNGFNFTVYRASGGFVVQFASYDMKNDRSDTKLTIVNQEEDLGQSIAHIITMEALRN